jgi:hypothetical protein
MLNLGQQPVVLDHQRTGQSVLHPRLYPRDSRVNHGAAVVKDSNLANSSYCPAAESGRERHGDDGVRGPGQ